MRSVDNNRAENFIRKHEQFKRWLIFALCIALITGTVTLYMMNKPATAMTEEGAQQIGLVLETADSEFEQGIIEQMEQDEASEEAFVEEDDASDAATEGGSAGEAGDDENSAASLGSSLEDGELVADADSAASLGSSLTEEELAAANSSASLGSSLTEEELAAANSSASLASSLTEEELAAAASSASTTEETALSQDVVLTVAYLDQDGEALADEREINLSESINFTEEAREIEGYVFEYALIDGIEITVITAKLDENEHKYYEAVLAGGTTVNITEDMTVVLVYKSAELAEKQVETEVIEYIPKVSLKGTLVDDFGTEIDHDKYSEIELPSFEEELALGDTENAPYKNVKVKTGLFKYNTYSYVKATYDGKVITGIMKEEVEGVVKKNDETTDTAEATSAASEEASTEASTSETLASQNASEIEKELVTLYYYTTDGNEYTRFEEDAIINFVYTTGDQTEYRYEDEKVSIVAKLQKPGAIPEEAELQITQITSDTTGYNYNAYMSVLNDNAETIASDAGQEEATTYDDSNTLMYDIAFMYEGEEIQPAEGAVSISLEFKNNQLTNDLSVCTEEDVTVVHLPIKEEVKEQSEISSTSEATNITSGDIEVKTLTDATTELNGVEKVEFSEDNFSVFVFVSGTSQKNTWNGRKSITLNDFSGISSLFNYSVVANELTNTGHLEGNIRVGTLYTDRNGSVLNNGSNRITQNPITEINVVKTVVNGNDGIFKFRFFNEYKVAVGPEFTIETNNKTGTKQILNTDEAFSNSVFAALNAGSTLYVYELRNDGSIIEENVKYNNYTVSYTYTDILGYDVEEVANDHDANYIGEFESSTGEVATLGNNYFGTNENYVGETYEKDSDGHYHFGSDKDVIVQNGREYMFTYVDGLKSAIGSDIAAAREVSVALADAKNYASGNNTTSNLVNVLNLVSTTGKLQEDLTAANLASPYISGLIASDQYLLINIAVDESRYSTYEFNGVGLFFDDTHNVQDSYSPLASHVIYNFVNANRTASYGGTIRISGNNWSDGLMLAPSATVDQTGQYFQGEIIGNAVKHGEGNEFHKKTITSGKAVTVNVLNTADGGLVVYKQVNGEPANASYDGKFRFTIERYYGSGVWNDITSQISPEGITNKYDSASELSMIAIPLPNLEKDKTTYFRIHEDAGTTVNGLTNDTSYIYVAVVTDKSGSVSSIRYYKVRGDYRFLYSPDYSINRSGATEVAGSAAAFNNIPTKTSLVVTKKWNGGDKWLYVYAYVCGRANSNDVYGKVIQLSEENNWTETVTDLPAYDQNGAPIIYRVVEIGQKANSIDEIQTVNNTPINLLYDQNAANTQSEQYEGYTASYSTDLSESNILSAIGTTSVTAPERVGAVGELSGTVTITNTYNYENVTLSLFKYLDGKDPENATFEFNISVLKNDYSLVELGTTTNIGSSISYTTEIKNEYVITKESNNEQNVYFLIKEKDVSSNQFTKDYSYIIAKVKNLGTKDQTVFYYRVSKDNEKAEVDSDTQKIVAYANDGHKISDSADVAFYNTSYSITIKKEWYGSDGNELSKETYDDNTAVNILVWQTGNGLTPVIYQTVTLSKANNWEYTLNNVPRVWNSSNQQYVYYIQECDNFGNSITDSAFVGYYKIVNGVASSITNQYNGVDIRGNEDKGTLVLVCRNIRSNVVLPETGGVGTAVYVLIGLAIIALAAMGLIFAGKRARRA
jgi:LPXTG-motif cell wall-anchored protein